ncbi:MAG: HD-GYP domain-containing protein, partial [bacterium]|nr:HD-GYP domain-containing protein [bacterium]
PHNLSKNAIPKGAQIIAVADAFDALTSDRPYRKGLGWDSALAKLKRESIGTQFDPEIITTFLLMMHDESIKRNKKKTKRESVEMLNIK